MSVISNNYSTYAPPSVLSFKPSRLYLNLRKSYQVKTPLEVPANLEKVWSKLGYFISRSELEKHIDSNTGKFDSLYLRKIEKRLEGFASLFPKKDLSSYHIRYKNTTEDRIVSHIDNLVPQIQTLIEDHIFTKNQIRTLFANRPNTWKEELYEIIQQPWFKRGVAAWMGITAVLSYFFTPVTAVFCSIIGAILFFGIIACKLASSEHDFGKWKQELLDYLNESCPYLVEAPQLPSSPTSEASFDFLEPPLSPTSKTSVSSQPYTPDSASSTSQSSLESGEDSPRS